MKPEDIRSLWIRYDEEDKTYSIDIDTSSYTVSFPKTQIQFTCADNIALPYSIVILDENNNIVNTYSLTARVQQPEQPQEQSQDQPTQSAQDN
jgi:hypothetical protein